MPLYQFLSLINYRFAVYFFQALFGIQPDTGKIFVNSTLDRETVQEVVLHVFVQDIMAEVPVPIQTATGEFTE